MSLPLEGIKVLELTQWAYGPRAAAFLAEMGAEVIKMENPTGGEPTRGSQTIRGVPVQDYDCYYQQNHRGKRSLAIDLRHEKGREAAHRLVKESDVFLTNLRMGPLERLRLDYNTLSGLNPRLVYALGTGWGLRGPHRERGAFEATGFARSGLAATFTEPSIPPALCPPATGDYTAAVFLAFGVMVALFHRQRTGEGQLVHNSLLGSCVTLASLAIDVSLASGQDALGTPYESSTSALYNIYRTKDGRWIQLANNRLDDYWPQFCEAVGIEHLKDDPRFTANEERAANGAALFAILREAFLTRPQKEWEERLDRYDLIWSPIRYPTELATDEQLLENGYITYAEHPTHGKIKVTGLAVELSKTPGKLGTWAPTLGQHTEEILLEAGYTWDDVAAMKEQKVIP